MWQAVFKTRLLPLHLLVAFHAGVPTVAGKLLHIDDRIGFVDDFKTEYRLHDIFHRDDSAETTVFVDDKSDLLFMFKEFFPYGRYRFISENTVWGDVYL